MISLLCQFIDIIFSRMTRGNYQKIIILRRQVFMKRLVNISVSTFSTKWPSSDYIDEYDRFNIDCTEVSENIGVFKDKYLLKLEGTKENIQMFLDYLKFEGFKIQ